MNTEQERKKFVMWIYDAYGLHPSKLALLTGGDLFRAWQAGRAALQSQDREDAPDMFWNADDPERYGGECLHDAVVYAIDEFSDSDLPVDLIFECAKRMPDITVRVTARDEDGNPVYEVVDHARRVEGES